jgi:NitT/TauT family transport system substrate-binding protein
MKLLSTLCSLVAALSLLTGCGDSSPKKNAEGKPVVTIQLNWKAEPQFGGFYAAKSLDSGLQIDVRAGGPGLATIDMVAAGTVPFAIVSGDELVIARSRGKDVVALFAAFQTNPQGIMAPAARGLKSIEDVFNREGTLAMEKGLPYAKYLEKKYGFSKLKVVPSPGGDLTAFRTTPDYAMQCFVISEPLTAKRQGLDATTFLIADAGWNPYTTVLVTNADYLKKNPQVVDLTTKAVAAGWKAYLENPKPANDAMRKDRPELDDATFAELAAAQVPLIATDETKKLGLGAMTRERWEQLVKQLVEVGAIEKPVDVEPLYRVRD